MKKTLLSLFALFITTMAFAYYDAEIDGIYYDIVHMGYGQVYAAVSNDGYIKDGAGYSQTEIVIPENITLDGVEYSVNRILSEAFYGCKNLTKITILSSLSIDDNAFYGCESLTAIVWDGEHFSTSGLPNSVESIILGNNVREIGSFSGLDKLTSITIPINVSRIYYKAFANAKNITSIEWNAKRLNSIYGYGDNDDMYTSILPKSVKKIIFGDGVESIFPNLCRDLVNLTSVVMSNSISKIGKCAFSDCTALTSVTISENIREIYDYTFADCSSLTSITIPKHVLKVGHSAFSNCTALTSITIPYTTTTLNDAFENCSSITSVNLIVDSIEDCCRFGSNFTESTFETVPMHLIMNDKEIINLVIPESVTTIHDDAFFNCSNIMSVTIPNSITSIGWRAFRGCYGLTLVNISDLSAWCNISFSDLESNPLYYAKNLYLNEEKMIDLMIPEGVEVIRTAAFVNCESLKSVTMSKDVTTIGSSAFSGCTGLASVKIPNSVTSIGFNAFYKCNNIDTITCLAITPPDVRYNEVFSNYDCLLLVPENSLDAYKNHRIWGKFKNIRGFKEKYIISTSVNDEMMGSVSEGGVYEEDSEIILTATPKEGYGFVKWSDDNTENPRKVVVSKDSTFTAIFGKLYTVTASANDKIMGIVLGTGEYGEGSEITLTAKANEGYHFVKWSDGNIENPRTIVVTEGLTLSAEFAINQYEVNVSADKNGTVKGGGMYNYGEEAIIEAIANKGYHFVKWSDGNTENPRTIVITEDLTLTAEFALDETPVEDTEESSVIVYVHDGMVYVEGVEEDYHVLDAMGRLVYKGHESILLLPRGVYVIRIGNEEQKIIF